MRRAMLRRGVCVSLLVGLFSLASACGGGSSSDTASFRLVLGSPDAPLSNLVIDGTTQASNMSYGNATGYISLKTGSRHVQLIPANASKAIYDANVSLAASANETLVLIGPVTQLQTITLTDGGTSPPTG